MLLSSTKEVANSECNKIIEKVVSVLTMWKQRSLKITGKVTMINALIGSLFTYKMQAVLLFSDNHVTKFNRIIEDFIWNGRKINLI